jgi:hypothetical protein
MPIHTLVRSSAVASTVRRYRALEKRWWEMTDVRAEHAKLQERRFLQRHLDPPSTAVVTVELQQSRPRRGVLPGAGHRSGPVVTDGMTTAVTR